MPQPPKGLVEFARHEDIFKNKRNVNYSAHFANTKYKADVYKYVPAKPINRQLVIAAHIVGSKQINYSPAQRGWAASALALGRGPLGHLPAIVNQRWRQAFTVDEQRELQNRFIKHRERVRHAVDEVGPRLNLHEDTSQDAVLDVTPYQFMQGARGTLDDIKYRPILGPSTGVALDHEPPPPAAPPALPGRGTNHIRVGVGSRGGSMNRRVHRKQRVEEDDDDVDGVGSNQAGAVVPASGNWAANTLVYARIGDTTYPAQILYPHPLVEGWWNLMLLHNNMNVQVPVGNIFNNLDGHVGNVFASLPPVVPSAGPLPPFVPPVPAAAARGRAADMEVEEEEELDSGSVAPRQQRLLAEALSRRIEIRVGDTVGILDPIGYVGYDPAGVPAVVMALPNPPNGSMRYKVGQGNRTWLVPGENLVGFMGEFGDDDMQQPGGFMAMLQGGPPPLALKAPPPPPPPVPPVVPPVPAAIPFVDASAQAPSGLAVVPAVPLNPNDDELGDPDSFFGNLFGDGFGGDGAGRPDWVKDIRNASRARNRKKKAAVKAAAAAAVPPVAPVPVAVPIPAPSHIKFPANDDQDVAAPLWPNLRRSRGIRSWPAGARRLFRAYAMPLPAPQPPVPNLPPPPPVAVPRVLPPRGPSRFQARRTLKRAKRKATVQSRRG